MDKKVRERRRSVSRERGRRRAAVIVACVAVVVAAALFMYLRSSDVFIVERVTATPLTYVTEEQIAGATAPARGENLLALSTGPIEERLAALPYVQSARVIRRFPHSLEVRLVEHSPVARLKAGDGSVWLVSQDGRLLEKKNLPGLPLFVPEIEIAPQPGEYVPASVVGALSAAGVLHDLSTAEAVPPLRQATIALTGDVVLQLHGGTEVRLGEPERLKQKLTVVGAIIEQYLRDGKRIQYVDASVPERVAVKAE